MLHFTITCEEMSFIFDEDFYSIPYEKEHFDKLALQFVKEMKPVLSSKRHTEKDFSFSYEPEKDCFYFYRNGTQFFFAVNRIINNVYSMHELEENVFMPNSWYSCVSLIVELSHFLSTLKK